MFDHQEELDEYLEKIEELIKNKQYARLRDLFLPMEPADIALLLEEAGGEQMPLLYRLLPKELAAEVFVELESDSQEMLINGFSNTELKEVLDELYLDDAVDIVEEMPASVVIRKIKANLVSVNVDRLVQEGYLERRAVAGDRRKTQLLCTEKAQPVIARGREVQERFFARLLDNTDAPTREAFFRTMEVIGKNLDEILKENG